jgi:cobyrinic acid a,c-diamide synthase
MAALRAGGTAVASAKVGPDFIDPGYHTLATGRPGRNLDAWICGETAIPPLAAHGGAGADLLIIEGVMGLFDGVGSTTEASTAHVARVLDAPVVLVVDASAISGSVAALVHGYTTFDPAIGIAGVVLNRVGSDGHETLLREALAPTNVSVLGALRRDDRFSWRDRHLGLVPVVERPQETRAALDRLAAAVAQSIDLDRVMKVAWTARSTTTPPLATASPSGRCRLAVAAGAPFSFTYPDNLERLQEAGAELLPFDPMNDRALPPGADGLVAGGGFPEVFAANLAANAPLLADVRTKAAAGLVTWAECGGLIWLARRLDGRTMCGVIDAEAKMTDRLTMGYRTAVLRSASPFGSVGRQLRGHEFHYSTIEPAGDALQLEGRFGRGLGGWASPTLLASYLHLHLGAAPELAESLVRTATAAKRAPVT